MRPGPMPSPSAPGPTKGFLQRQSGSLPAGAAWKTGVLVLHWLVHVLPSPHSVSLMCCSPSSVQTLPLGKQAEPEWTALRQPLAGRVPRPQLWRGRIRENLTSKSSEGRRGREMPQSGCVKDMPSFRLWWWRRRRRKSGVAPPEPLSQNWKQIHNYVPACWIYREMKGAGDKSSFQRSIKSRQVLTAPEIKWITIR